MKTTTHKIKHIGNLIFHMGLLSSLMNCEDGFLKQQAGTSVVLEDVHVESEGGISKATLSANSTTTQVIALDNVEGVEGASIEIPPGSLSVDTNISVEPGTSLANSFIATELGLDEENTVTTGSGALAITSEEEIDAESEFTVGIPLTDSGASLTDGEKETLIIIYKVNVYALGIVKTGIIPRSEISLVDGVAKFKIKYFGVYQAAYTKEVVIAPKVVETKAEENVIFTQTQEKTRIATEWKSVVISLEGTQLNIVSTVSNSQLKSCNLLVDRDKVEPIDFVKRDVKINSTVTIDRYRYENAFVKFECVEESGAMSRSPWSNEVKKAVQRLGNFAILTPQADAIFTQAIKISWNESINATSYKLQVSPGEQCSGGDTYQTKELEYRYSFVTPGRYTICVTALGNQQSLPPKNNAVHVIFDNQGPKFSFEMPDAFNFDSDAVNGEFVFGYHAEDNLFDIKRVFFSIQEKSSR